MQYTESIPSAEGGNPSTPHKHPPVAKAADNGGASAPTDKAGNPLSDSETESAENESSSKEGGVPATANGRGTGQGNPGGSANNGSKAPVQHGGQNAAGAPSSHSSSGSSSSPLVPILIAIAILAAVSVGAVMIRQRRQRRGPTPAASPKAS